jgi:hypothetical protein
LYLAELKQAYKRGDLVMQVHSTLRHLTAEAGKRNRLSQSSFEPITAKGATSNI